MVILFSYLAKMTLAKGVKLFKKETKTRKERKERESLLFYLSFHRAKESVTV